VRRLVGGTGPHGIMLRVQANFEGIPPVDEQALAQLYALVRGPGRMAREDSLLRD